MSANKYNQMIHIEVIKDYKKIPTEFRDLFANKLKIDDMIVKFNIPIVFHS